MEGMPGIRTFRPLAYASFALNYYAGGYNVFGYHLVNIAIHYLTALILFLFIFYTLNLTVSNKSASNRSYETALLTSALWAIHPIQVSTVTYIVQRMACLVALFYILSMFFYLKGRIALDTSERYGCFFLCVVSGAAAFATKQNAYMLPVSILVYELIVLRQYRSHQANAWMKILIPAIGILFLYYIIRMIPALSHGYADRPFTMWQRVLTEPRVIIFYFTLLLYPITSRFTLLHDIALSTDLLHPWTTLPSIVLLLSIIMGCIVIAVKRPLVSFCILFFLINHAIEGSFVGLEIVFEHRNYLPAMLFFVPIARIVVAAVNNKNAGRLFRWLVGVAAVIILITVGIGAYTYNSIFGTELSLWADNVEKAPVLHRPLHNLAIVLWDGGDQREACARLQRSLDFREDARKDQKAQTYFYLGRCDRANGESNRAYGNYLKAIEIVPDYADTYDAMAQVKMEAGDLTAAEKLIRRALTIDASVAVYHLDYARILLKMGRSRLARKETTKSIITGGPQKTAYSLISESFRQQGLNLAADHFQSLSVPTAFHSDSRQPVDRDKDIQR